MNRIAKTFKMVRSTVAGVWNLWLNAYASTDKSRKELFNSLRLRNATSNQVLAGNLSTLTAQCRQIERTTPLGRAVVDGAVSDIVGTGIDILPNTGDTKTDYKLLDAWQQWAECCIVDGSSLWSWQSVVVRDIYTAGSALARFVILPERAKKGMIPLAILPLEVEWLSEFACAKIPEGHRFIRGIEVDGMCRPVAYHLKHPEMPVGSKGEIVPAAQIIHIFEHRRAQQVHGEPVLAPAVERLLQDSRLVENELKAAIATSAPAVAITSANAGLDGDDTDDDGESITDIPAGATVRLRPGETVQSIENNRPAAGIKDFRATVIGDLAACTRTSAFWLDRDPGKANFSSMRMDQLLSKRSLAGLKEVVGKGAAGRIYEAAFEWLMLVIGAQLPVAPAEKCAMMRYDLRPDQPEYVDPVKDTQASAFAIAQNLSTYDIECSAHGRDWKSVMRQRSIENEELDKLNLPRPSADTKKVSMEETTDPNTGEPKPSEDDDSAAAKSA